jgi:methanogenic corrinoid protein MtbC1
MGSAELRIGELSRRVGVSPAVLRAWERRYGLLQPRRTQGGQRLYSAADETRVRRMLAQRARGFSAGAAARLALAPMGGDHPPAARTNGSRNGGLDRITGDLTAAVEGFDDPGACTAIDSLLAGFALDTVLRDAVLPMLADLGTRWEHGEIGVAQEHFGSALVAGRLRGLARGWGRGDGPRAILACAPGERHELGLLSFGLALREYGWRLCYLGADTPVDAIGDAADRLDPVLIVVSAVQPAPLRAAATGLARLADRRPLALGGAGANAAIAHRAGARWLEGDAVSAAGYIASELGMSA